MNTESIQNQESSPTPENKKNLNILLSNAIFHKATSPHGIKSRGKGITQKNKEISKRKLRIQKKSVKINRNKKRHHMTKKEKKSR